MLFFGIKNLWFRLGIFVVLTIPTLFFIWKIYENFYLIDPYNPGLTGTKAYGHNSENSFDSGLIFMLIEYGILLVSLIPYSFHKLYFLRLLILQNILVGWFFLMALASMHGGGVQGIRLIWLLAINAIIFGLLILSIAAEIVGRRKESAIQHKF